MKRLLPVCILFTSLVFISCTKENSSVKVKYVNNTGEKIEQVNANGKLIRYIMDGGTTGYIGYEQFGTDSGMPDIVFNAKINGQPIEYGTKYFWCGNTIKSKLGPGNYTIIVELDSLGIEKFFYLHFQ